MADLQGFTLKGHPWELPSGEDGVMPGAADGWLIPSKGWALIFHTTTTTRAAAILRDGFDLSPAREVGGFRWLGPDAPAGRVMPSGVWASIRPTIPDDRDTWMPWVCDEPWEVLQIHTPAATLARKCVFEPTWPVVQFCLQPADVLGVRRLEPAHLPLLLHPETVRTLASFGQEEHHRPSPYWDAIAAKAARGGLLQGVA